MTLQKTRFLEQAEKIAFDLKHRNTLNYNISRYEEAFHAGLLQFADLENAKQRAANIKHKVLERLDEYLIEFEFNFKKRGGRVIWALGRKEAVKEILHILKHHDVKVVVKSKSLISEELELNEALARNGIESVETDLGEYIVQLSGEKPYHIVTPAMHKSKEDVAELFHKKFGTPAGSSPEEITSFVREKLREKFMRAGAGITGANFLIADSGAIAVTENEGNALMSVSFPGIHIVIAGIEKVIPSLTDLHLFWPLLSSHGTGQNLTVYNSILCGPAKENETDGPAEMIIVLIDNGRTELLGQQLHRRALSCIRCGACLNACPVYKNIGGYTYGTTYSGPIGSVINPYLNDFNQYIHLSFASSLCRHCTEVCPVKINLHELLLYNRNEAVKRGLVAREENMMIKGWKNIMLKRYRVDLAGARTKNRAMKIFFSKAWGKRRTLPVFSKKSFRQRWLENR
ncbi:MAG: lactate utilization protein B [Bacteroidales bacterium]|nr:lactate utilization protein B [Bacteroidales bacterium]